MEKEMILMSKASTRPILITLLCCFIGSYISSTSKAAEGEKLLSIRKVGLDRKTFSPSKSENVTLNFEVTSQANIQVIIYDELGERVRVFGLGDVESGMHNITWDGRRTDGAIATGNVFLYVIESKTKEGQKAIYDRALETGGIEVEPLEYTFDRKTGNIEYVLPKTCMVRIRAGIKDGMFIKSILDWTPQTAGRHIYKWDGKDESGMMYLLNHSDLNVRLACYTLPDNTIISTDGLELHQPGQGHSDPNNDRARSQIWATEGKYLHYGHNPSVCHSPKFSIAFPQSSKEETSDIPVISGIVPLRIELDPRDAEHLVNTRFEIMLFIDGTFIYEIEEGSSPFTFNWNTKDFAKGPHIITINIIAYDDHIGIVSRKVIVGEQQQ